MALPSSGSISLAAVNTELGFSSTSSINLGSTGVRNLFGVSSGAISMANGYGKSAQFVFNKTISVNTLNYILRDDMVANGYPGSGAFTANITVAAGVHVWSDSTSLPGFDTGSLSGGTINITNNGFITGKGGRGSGALNSSSNTAFSEPTVGGPALSLGASVNIANNSYIAGGGGGGGHAFVTYASGGGGAGGGMSGDTYHLSGGYRTGSAGGGPGGTGTTGSYVGYTTTGGGGGRILPGTGGAGGYISTTTGASPGNGGGSGGGGGLVALQLGTCGGSGTRAIGYCITGGGGGWGASGGSGGGTTVCNGTAPSRSGSGGDANAVGANAVLGTTTQTAYPGAVGGKAVNLNGFTVTWNATGNRYGAIA